MLVLTSGSAIVIRQITRIVRTGKYYDVFLVGSDEAAVTLDERTYAELRLLIEEEP